MINFLHQGDFQSKETMGHAKMTWPLSLHLLCYIICPLYTQQLQEGGGEHPGRGRRRHQRDEGHRVRRPGATSGQRRRDVVTSVEGPKTHEHRRETMESRWFRSDLLIF